MVTTKEKSIAGRQNDYDKGVKAYCHKSYQITKEGSKSGTRNK